MVVAGARLTLAFLGFSALVTEVATLLARDRLVVANFLSYFTVESNLLAVVSLVLGAFSAAARRTTRALDYYRGGVTVAMTTVILVFVVLLSGYSSRELTAVPWDNTVLHYVMPVAIVLDWLVTTRPAPIPLGRALTWLLLPLAYLAYSVVRGAVVGWYPYPFMNPDLHGYGGLLLTSVAIAVVVGIVAWAVRLVPRLTYPRLIRGVDQSGLG